MGNKDADRSVASDLTNEIVDYTVPTKDTDGAHDTKETYYDIENWSKWFGYYSKIPELTEATNTKARWIVGKGYKADPKTTLILDAIKGWGKDTFNTILENMIRVMYIAGDAFAEIIVNEGEETLMEEGILINLKPLDPGVMRIVVNGKGLIIRYEQTSKNEDGTVKVEHRFKPEQIFHLARNRIADEIHGVSIIPAIEQIILMRNEAMTDWKKVLHWNVRPRWKISLDTDNEIKIASIKTKYDAASAKGENFYIPMGSHEVEVLGVAPNATLNPLPWIEALNNYFYQAVGVPEIIIGGGTASLTDASSKIKYLAFEQTIQEEQLFMEEQVLSQLNLSIKLEMPAKLEQDAMSGKQNEDKPQQPNTPQEEPIQQPGEANDTKAEVPGNT